MAKSETWGASAVGIRTIEQNVEVKTLVGLEEKYTFDEDAAAGPSERFVVISFHRFIIASDMMAIKPRQIGTTKLGGRQTRGYSDQHVQQQAPKKAT
jgi:hypothetical protein